MSNLNLDIGKTEGVHYTSCGMIISLSVVYLLAIWTRELVNTTSVKFIALAIVFVRQDSFGPREPLMDNLHFVKNGNIRIPWKSFMSILRQ
jgi:hypothetical protein